MLAFLLLVTGLCWYGAFRWRRRRMYELAARVQGPPELPLIGHAHRVSGTTEDIMKGLQDFSRCAMKNDGLSKVWLGPLLYYVMTDPVDLEFVLKICLEKDDLHRFARTVIGYGGIFAPVSIWRRRRKIMVPTFSPRVLDQFVEIFAEQSDILSRRLAAQRDSEPLSVWPFLSTYTLDSVCESTMGVKIGAQKNENIPILKSLNKVLHLVCKRVFHLWLQPNWLYRLFPEYQELKGNCKILHNFTDELELELGIKSAAMQTIIYDHRCCSRWVPRNFTAEQKGCRVDWCRFMIDKFDADINLHQRKTFLDLLITQSGGTKGYDNTELREEVLTLIVAGTDTSAVALGFTLMLLAKYPDVQERIYRELCDVFGKSDRQLVKEDLSKLVYTERVIKESLRLFPPVPFIIRKVEEETILPSGRILPAGAGVAVSIWGVHRDPTHWGSDADHFVPDRFLPERFKMQHACSYIPFSNGPRNCLGYQYAMMSVKMALASVLRRCFVLGEAERGRVPHIDVKLEVMMKPVNNFRLRLTKRI